MFEFPNTFKREYTDYITKKPLGKFIQAHKLDGITSNSHRADIINAITFFANTNADNEEIVDQWLDESIRSGKRDIYIKLLSLSENDKNNLKSDSYVQNHLIDYLPDNQNRHISKNRYDYTYKCVSYSINNTEYGIRVSTLECRLIKTESGSKEILPVICDIFVDKSVIILRIKPVSDAWDEDENGNLKKIAINKEAEKVISDITNKLDIVLMADGLLSYAGLKHKLYNMMKKYIETPKEIQYKIDLNREKINNISKIIQQEICNVDESYEKDILLDVQNLVEKYIAISQPDKQIFTKDKEAYPIMLAAKDEEESFVKQEAALKEPLQMKAVFYDNKKMIIKNKKCDGIMFAIKGKKNGKEFVAKYEIRTKGCIVKFYEYVEEEDSNAAIFSFLDSEE